MSKSRVDTTQPMNCTLAVEASDFVVAGLCLKEMPVSGIPFSTPVRLLPNKEIMEQVSFQRPDYQLKEKLEATISLERELRSRQSSVALSGVVLFGSEGAYTKSAVSPSALLRNGWFEKCSGSILRQDGSKVSALVTLENELSSPIQPNVAQRRFASDLISCLKMDASEGGDAHSADDLIENLIRSNSQDASSWLTVIFTEISQKSTALATDLLRCIGRLPESLIGSWGYKIASAALASLEYELRDAAVQVLESWESDQSFDLLSTHLNREEDAWLSKYIRKVVNEW